jgi:hypothetical protein
LVDLAVQAVDGTKVAANAAGDQTYDGDESERLLVRKEAAINDLENRNAQGADPLPPRLPTALQRTQALRKRIQEAMEHLAQEHLRRVNLTDPDAQLMKGR